MFCSNVYPHVFTFPSDIWARLMTGAHCGHRAGKETSLSRIRANLPEEGILSWNLWKNWH